MKEITREVTKTETMYYEAVDGARFSSREECEKYEKSAKCVVLKEIEKYKLGRISEYELFEAGCDDYGTDIYNIANAEVLNKLNIYRNLCDPHIQNIGEEYIGKPILLAWDYEECSSYNLGTIDELLGRIRNNYIKAITPKEEKKED